MKATEHTMTLRDGAELFYRAWLPETPARKALFLFHRGHEHSGRWQETVEALNLPGVAIFAWDARGHGLSPGERGSAKDLSVLVKDMDEFVRRLSQQHGIALQDVIALGQSVGAVIVAAWVHDYAPPLRAMILAVPAFRVKLYVPFAIPLLRLRQKLFGSGYVKSYVKAKVLTHEPEQAVRYHTDPLIFRQIAVNILLDLYDTSTRLVADAGAITLPTLVLSAGSDWVVKVSAQQQFFDRLFSPLKRLKVFPGLYHAVFHEKDRHLLVGEVRQFIEGCFQKPPPRVSLLKADRTGYTFDEYEALRQPGSFQFTLMRLLLKTLGRLSRGIQLGWTWGFDSGATLDYVYENKPQGITPLGRFIDYFYLNTIGWRGIRVRRAILQQMICATIEKTHRAGKPVRVLDIAAGCGRYVLEAVKQLAPLRVEAMLRDYNEQNLASARGLSEALGVQGITFARGDAFDRGSLAAVRPRPNIGIVSGLYELFPDNEPVLNSLRGLADLLEPGDHLIYTNQPWHPQVELIARTLLNREGQPWIMRRRTQAEMDELVWTAGFEKIDQEIEPAGIFTVAIAQRRN